MQGALNEDESLTVVGRTLANLPVDVSLGKMLIMGTLFHQNDSVMALAAALSVQSPFTNDAFRNSDCVAARKNLDSDHGDPITLLNAYREWLQVKAEDREPSRKWCRKRGLEEQGGDSVAECAPKIAPILARPETATFKKYCTF